MVVQASKNIALQFFYFIFLPCCPQTTNTFLHHHLHPYKLLHLLANSHPSPYPSLHTTSPHIIPLNRLHPNPRKISKTYSRIPKLFAVPNFRASIRLFFFIFIVLYGNSYSTPFGWLRIPFPSVLTVQNIKPHNLTHTAKWIS